MKTRCTNEKVNCFKNYGGRGINFCDKWETFGGFFDDMYLSYKDNLTLERVDNNGNYSKENCRWATKKEQARNRRTTNLIRGKTLAEWSEILGIKRSTLAQRFYVYGWSVDRVLTK